MADHLWTLKCTDIMSHTYTYRHDNVSKYGDTGPEGINMACTATYDVSCSLNTIT